MLKLEHRGRILLCMLCTCAFATAAPAADYPQRPVRMIVGLPPGGSTDIMGRLIAAKLAERFGQQFVFDNRPGASGIIGADIVAKSQPDGYTLLMAGGSFGTISSLYANAPFDTARDFAPIACLPDDCLLREYDVALPWKDGTPPSALQPSLAA